jgi:hypothetical protein
MSAELEAENTLDVPQRVPMESSTFEVRGAEVTQDLPPRSVSVLRIARR